MNNLIGNDVNETCQNVVKYLETKNPDNRFVLEKRIGPDDFVPRFVLYMNDHIVAHNLGVLHNLATQCSLSKNEFNKLINTLTQPLS